MVIFKRTQDVIEYISTEKGKGIKYGFVPTMGALHYGHLSLIAQARKEGQAVICSIFVNPTQFNDKKDLEKYPITTDADIELLVKAGCDVLFLPGVEEIYPGGEQETRSYEFGYLDTILEGARRPGHFKGVGQVVARLLAIVQPDCLFLGQKDYQQCLVLKNLVSQLAVDQIGGNVPQVLVEVCPTLREQDGLAMSSRNRRLTDPQRAVAGTIYQCLVSIQAKSGHGKFATVRKECIEILQAKGFVPEYVSLASATDLRLLTEYEEGTPMVALIAAYIGEIRLIDNILL